MVNVLASNAIDREFEPDQVKPGICCFSAFHVTLRRMQRPVGSESG